RPLLGPPADPQVLLRLFAEVHRQEAGRRLQRRVSAPAQAGRDPGGAEGLQDGRRGAGMRPAARASTFVALAALSLTLLRTWSGPAAGAGQSLRVAMILWRGPTEAEKGFKDGLKELGYSVEYTELNANQDRGELGRLLRETIRPRLDALDYLYTYGTTVTL